MTDQHPLPRSCSYFRGTQLPWVLKRQAIQWLCFSVVLWGVGEAGRTASASSMGSTKDCPRLQQTAEIQNQFQLYQHASSWLSDLQEKQLLQILKVNDASLAEFGCFAQRASDPLALSDVLGALKLQILNLRYQAFKKDKPGVSRSLLALRTMIANTLQQPSMMARRLGASVRSLYLDELERLLDVFPQLVKDEVSLGYWSTDFSSGIEKEIVENWQTIQTQFSKASSPRALAKSFNDRPWKGQINSASKLNKILHRLGTEKEETLETQLFDLFQANNVNFDVRTTDQTIKHYLNSSLQQMKKNNYFLLKPWLDPVIDEKVRTLKSELGVSHTLIFPLVGVELEGPFKELERPIELLDSARFTQAKVHYARVKNPIGRLYEIVILKRITQVWSQADLLQLRIDLNRLSFLKTLLAVYDYEKRFAHWPKSMDDLVQQKLIQAVPKDYFTGQDLRYDSQHRQIWSVGENGVDEKGKGDDLSLSMTL